MSRELIARTIRVQENKSSSNEAALWSAVRMINEITAILTTNGFKRVDSNGDHGYESHIAPPSYIYASFVPASVDYPTESSQYFLTIRNNSSLTSSSQGLYWGLTTTIPSDSSSSQSFSPYSTASFVASSGQAGAVYYKILALDYCVLTNTDVALFGFAQNITRLSTDLRFGVLKNAIVGLLDLNSNQIYGADGTAAYLGTLGTSYTPTLTDEYTDVGANDRSKVIVAPVGIAPTSTTSQNVDYSGGLTDICQISGGLQRTAGDVLQLHQNNSYRRYVQLNGHAYCFYQDS